VYIYTVVHVFTISGIPGGRGQGTDSVCTISMCTNTCLLQQDLKVCKALQHRLYQHDAANSKQPGVNSTGLLFTGLLFEGTAVTRWIGFRYGSPCTGRMCIQLVISSISPSLYRSMHVVQCCNTPSAEYACTIGGVANKALAIELCLSFTSLQKVAVPCLYSLCYDCAASTELPIELCAVRCFMMLHVSLQCVYLLVIPPTYYMYSYALRACTPLSKLAREDTTNC
jgi:hypothetical protein